MLREAHADDIGLAANDFKVVDMDIPDARRARSLRAVAEIVRVVILGQIENVSSVNCRCRHNLRVPDPVSSLPNSCDQ